MSQIILPYSEQPKDPTVDSPRPKQKMTQTTRYWACTSSIPLDIVVWHRAPHGIPTVTFTAKTLFCTLISLIGELFTPQLYPSPGPKKEEVEYAR
jgi:hypothetical protein